jgi:hypothetical protein
MPKNTGIVAVLLICIALLFFVTGFPKLLSTGWTTLSLSLVDIISNDGTLGGKAFLMTASANGGGEHSTGTWTPSSAGQPQNFSMTYDQLEQWCKFPMFKSGTKIYKARYIEVEGDNPIGCIGGCFDPNQWCYIQNHGTYGGGSSDMTGHYKYWCVGLDEYGEVGYFQDIAFMWKGQVTITSNKGTVSGVLGGLTEQNSIVIPDSSNNPAVWVKWAGNLVSGQDCSGKYPTTDVVPAYRYSDQRWNIANKQSLNYYNFYYTSLSNCLTNAADSQARQNCVDNVNASADSVVSNWNSIGDWVYASIDTSSASTPYARINTGLIQYPVLQFKIKADWVGIYAPCGTPTITQYDSSLSGIATNKLTGTATIRNDGSATSTFGATATCPSGISVDPIPNFEVTAGGTKQITYSVSASQAISGQCYLKVYDITCPNNQVTKPFWVEFERYCPITCTGNFVLDKVNCKCVCALTPRDCYTIDTTNCVYKQIPNCGGGCTLPCPDRYKPNAECNGCVCALDPNKAPEGYFLNTTSCNYEKTSGGGNWWDNTLLVCGGGLVLLGIFMALSKKRR